MLLQHNRLKKVKDFNLLARRGQWRRGALMDLKYLKLAENRGYFPKKEDGAVFAAQLKIAFAVGVKISKKAVERNRVKRQLSEMVRLFLRKNDIKGGYYLLFAPRKEIVGAAFVDIKKDVEKLLSWSLF